MNPEIVGIFYCNFDDGNVCIFSNLDTELSWGPGSEMKDAMGRVGGGYLRPMDPNNPWSAFVPVGVAAFMVSTEIRYQSPMCLRYYYYLGWPNPAKLCVDVIHSSEGYLIYHKCHFEAAMHWQRGWLDIKDVTVPYRVSNFARC